MLHASGCLPSACLITYSVYYSFCHLSYAILLWSSASFTVLHNIKVLKKCAIRIIRGANHRSHAQDLANELNILLFDDFVLYNCCMFMFDMIRGHIPATITQLFPLLFYTFGMLTWQHNFNLNVSRCTLNVYKDFIVRKGPYIWNSLSTHLKNVNNISTYLRETLYDNYYQFNIKIFVERYFCKKDIVLLPSVCIINIAHCILVHARRKTVI